VSDVLRFADCDQQSVQSLLMKLGMQLQRVADNTAIPGSFWGDEEAGLIRSDIYIRNDTPVHSILHEACHYVCMDSSRREALHTNAGGSQDEENAVCYLQILLSDQVTGFGRSKMFADMESWGYSFRLGSAEAWFNEDAEDAREWLQHKQLLELAD
jgi:hypothetical protein